MHGRGANRFDLLALADHFPHNYTIVFPEAPFPGAPWGYGPGSAWYQFLGRNRPEPESFANALDQLEQFIASFARKKVVLGGFSQGGTMSIAYALSHRDSIAGVINFSGFLADHPRVDALQAKGAQIFWGHGVHDNSIPFDLAVEGRAALESAGAILTAKDYDIGHWIDPIELADAIHFLSDVV